MEGFFTSFAENMLIAREYKNLFRFELAELAKYIILKYIIVVEFQAWNYLRSGASEVEVDSMRRAECESLKIKGEIKCPP